ncbi:hypothetical protein [Spiroplasma chrysopicola]|uniref:Uncharacterized protein n=1 Tax=Spiroplasma chrysopicola DF-1 TaxID=1276227 RepID=R4UAH9_9MOLU|nr:hypothetical protein [Spiroplasma chrysopicola]AGM24919.1 hypothetical protein SCHRY_v1c03340 [Spiroplasma chrysopicola DF-1]
MAAIKEKQKMTKEMFDKIQRAKWMEIKKEAIAKATPAMLISINRKTGVVENKNFKDYREKDGSAASGIFRAEDLIADRLGVKPSSVKKTNAAKKSNTIPAEVITKAKPAKKVTTKKQKN